MNVLLVTAHPLPESLCAALAERAAAALTKAGHNVVREDFYAQSFSPALTQAERAFYYASAYAGAAVAGQVERLLAYLIGRA